MTTEVTLVLVDGSNVARCGAWRRACPGTDSDDELRRRLVDAVCGWAARTAVSVVVAFDGAGPWHPGRLRVSPDVEVFGSGSRDGDHLLERLAATARRERREYWLVTSDRALQSVAGASAMRVFDSDGFVATELNSSTAAATESAAAPERASSGSPLGRSIDAGVRARLERLRRGEA